MNHQSSAGFIVKKIVLFTVLGFLSMILFGPIVAVVSVLLSLFLAVFPFILVGFLVWTAFNLTIHGREQTVQQLGHFGQGLVQAFPRLGERLLAVVKFPFRTLGRVIAGIGYAVEAVAGRVWALVRWLGPIAGMALTGVAVGAGIGAAVGAPAHDPAQAIAVNAALGGIMAAAVGVVLSIHERRAVRPSSVG